MDAASLRDSGAGSGIRSSGGIRGLSLPFTPRRRNLSLFELNLGIPVSDSLISLTPVTLRAVSITGVQNRPESLI